MQVCREVGAGAVLTNYFPGSERKRQPHTIFFRSQERNTELECFFFRSHEQNTELGPFPPGFLNWKCYFFFVLLRRRCSSLRSLVLSATVLSKRKGKGHRYNLRISGAVPEVGGWRERDDLQLVDKQGATVP